MPDGSTRPLVDVIGGRASWIDAPNDALEADARSKAQGHGEFDDDPDTMTSVVLRIRNTKDLCVGDPLPEGRHAQPHVLSGRPGRRGCTAS